MLKRLRAWIVGAVALVSLVWIVETSQTFKDCINQSKTETGEQSLHQRISNFLLILGRRQDCLGVFVHKNEGAITALATLLIAMFTLTLWHSTDKLWAAGERQFISTHRPRVRVRRAFLGTSVILGAEHLSHGDDVEIELTITNVGSTGATIVDSRFRIYFFKKSIPMAQPTYGEFPRKITDEKLRFAPGETRLMNVSGKAIMDAPPPGQRIMRQFGDSWAMHIIGEISYQDDAEIKRQTGFLREWKPGGSFGRINDPDYEYED